MYSIWICFDPPKKVGNAISRFSIQEEDLLGSVPAERADYDKLTVIMICLHGDTDEHGDKLIRLLNTVFSGKETAETIGEVLEEEYGIPRNYDPGKEVDIMSNLGEGILERGIQKGVQVGIKKMISNALKRKSAEEVADILDIPLEQVKSVEKEILIQK